MRALWCCLLVLFVLAPAGTVGITAAPSDAETALTAPRASFAATARKVLADPTPVHAVVATTVCPLRIVERAVSAPARSPQLSIETACVVTAGPRAPPA